MDDEHENEGKEDEEDNLILKFSLTILDFDQFISFRCSSV